MKYPSIVAIGGGHGLSALLRALLPLPLSLTAIVAVSDDGGSSGRLRRLYPMPAPGDVRACLAALADPTGPLAALSELRLGRTLGAELAGHCLGNLMLLALTEKHQGDFASAVDEAHALWQVQGTVLPVSPTPLTLCALTPMGETVRGETQIGHVGRVERLWLEPADAQLTPGVAEALKRADVILLGPGSLHTSLIPTLLVPGVVEAIRRSNARKAYLCNLRTQAGETVGYRASDHVALLEAHSGSRLFTHVLVNTRTPDDAGDSQFVPADLPELTSRGYQPVCGRYWEAADTHHFAATRLRAFVEWLLSDEAITPHQTYPEFQTIAQRIQ